MSKTSVCNDNELLKLWTAEMGETDAQTNKMQFAIFQEYGKDEKAFAIDFDLIWSWLGFSKKFTASRAFICNFKLNVDYIEQSKEEYIKSLNKGAQQEFGSANRNRILLNFVAYKKFCMIANTSKSPQNRAYVLKIENVMKMIADSKHIQYLKNEQQALVGKISQASQQTSKDADRKIELGRHAALVEANLKTSLVYILRLQEFQNDSFIVKIGYTKDNLTERIRAASSNYGCKALVLDVFPCYNSYNLEQAIFCNHVFLANQFTGKINNKSTSIETCLVKNSNAYTLLKRFITKEIKDPKYHSSIADQLQLINATTEQNKVSNQTLQLNIQKDMIAIQVIELQSKHSELASQVKSSEINEVTICSPNLVSIQPLKTGANIEQENQKIKLKNNTIKLENQRAYFAIQKQKLANEAKLLEEFANIYLIFENDKVGLLNMMKILAMRNNSKCENCI